MADEFQLQAEVCGGSRWWNYIPSRSMFGVNCASGGISDFGWQLHSDVMVDMKSTRSSTTTTTNTDESCSASDSSIVIQDMHKQPPHPNLTDSAATLQILGIGSNLSSPPSSTTTDHWINRTSLQSTSNGRSKTNSYPPPAAMLMPEQDDQQNPCSSNSMNYSTQEAGMEDVPSCPATHHQWNNLSSSTNYKCGRDDEYQPGDLSAGGGSNTGFPIGSVSYGNSNNYSSTLLQTLFSDDQDNNPQQTSLLYANLNEFLPPNEFSPSSLPNQTNCTTTTTATTLQFLNRNLLNTNFCTNNNNNSSTASNNFRPIPLVSQSTSTSSSIINDQKPNFLKVTGHGKINNENVQGMVGSSVAKKCNSNEAAAAASFKRPRIETPSPLPTFKVRKEKLGDRITALQQLVSPFGKTDTASVLHEAIEYIKFLHDQVGVLSTPYLRNGGSQVVQRQQNCDHIKTKDQEGPGQDLRSRGLCLVPISSTFPVAAENTTDFWTPTFGGTFR